MANAASATCSVETVKKGTVTKKCQKTWFTLVRKGKRKGKKEQAKNSAIQSHLWKSIPKGMTALGGEGAAQSRYNSINRVECVASGRGLNYQAEAYCLQVHGFQKLI